MILPPSHPHRQTILIADDEPANLHVLMKALLDDCRVLFARNGDEALAIATREKPDLIILDVMMPVMDGYEVMRRLKADPAQASTPVIFLTGRSDEADERVGLEMGAVDYWSKPVSVEIARIRARNHLELKRSRDLLAKMAITDGLCQIANRRGFEDYLAMEWKRSIRAERPLSLILADIDHFKSFNDTHGHLAGDACLRLVAAAIERSLARATDLAARYGGEEFACILPDTERGGAMAIAEHIRLSVAAIGDVPVPITVSLGVSCILPTQDIQPESLISAADKALYRAKANGRNQALFAPHGG